MAGTKYGLITFQSDSKAAKALHRNGMWYLGQHQIAVLSLAQVCAASNPSCAELPVASGRSDMIRSRVLLSRTRDAAGSY